MSNNNNDSKNSAVTKLNETTDNITKSIKGTNKIIQDHLIQLVVHVIQHHDIRPIQHLVDVSAQDWKGLDRQALYKWLTEYAKCDIAKPELGELTAKVTFNKAGREDINCEDKKNPGARFCPWYKKASNPFAGFNLKQEVIKLVSRTSKMKTKKDQDKIKIDQNDIELMKIISSGKSAAALAALASTEFSLAGDKKDEVVIINATEKEQAA